MALYKDSNNIIHDDMNGMALNNPNWPNNCVPITYAEAEIIRQSKIVPLTYQQKRIQLYSSIGDQLDMIYHDQINGTTVWKDHIINVKALIPKI